MLLYGVAFQPGPRPEHPDDLCHPAIRSALKKQGLDKLGFSSPNNTTESLQPGYSSTLTDQRDLTGIMTKISPETQSITSFRSSVKPRQKMRGDAEDTIKTTVNN